MMADVERRGAYGLRLCGLSVDSPLVEIEAGAEWPAVVIQHGGWVQLRGTPGITTSRAVIELDGDHRLMIERELGTATSSFPPAARSEGQVVHPLLTMVGTVFAWWHGHSAFHGGGFVHEGGLWGILGGRESGKSSLLAALMQRGLPILTDDLLVVASGRGFCGPRCVDLRPGAAEALGLAARAQAVRGRERFRVEHAADLWSAALRGWIFPEWASRVEVRRLSPSERLQRLAAQRCTPDSDGTPLIELAALPAYELRRPRDWKHVTATLDCLLTTLAPASSDAVARPSAGC